MFKFLSCQPVLGDTWTSGAGSLLEIHIVVGRIHFLAAVGFMETLSPRPAGSCTSLSFKRFT